MAVAHLAEGRQVCAVDEIIVELHDIVEVRADRGERRFQILERLLRLRADVADDLAVAVDPELTCDINEAPRRGDLDDMGVAGRLSQRLRIDKSGLAHASSSVMRSRMPYSLTTRRLAPEWVRRLHA